jgi:hypothetical protein
MIFTCFELGRVKMFLFSTTSRPAEAHTAYYPIGTGISFPGDNAAEGVKLATHLHLVPRSRIAELYLHCPIRFHVIVLD